MIDMMKRFSYAPLLLLIAAGAGGRFISHKAGPSWGMLVGFLVGVLIVGLIDAHLARRHRRLQPAR